MKTKKFTSMIFCMMLSIGSMQVPVLAKNEPSPSMIKLSIPIVCEMDINESRSIGYVVGGDENTNKGITWESSDNNIATVDKYGRVTAIAEGDVIITAKSKVNPLLTTSCRISVVVNPRKTLINKEMTYFQGEAAQEGRSLQKLVDRYTLEQAKKLKTIPQSVKEALNGWDKNQVSTTNNNGAIWTLEDYGIKRLYDKEVNERDRIQYFMGSRYLPEGKITFIEDDGENGIWVISDQGMTHIKLVQMMGEEKAFMMTDASEEYISRRGMMSNASRDVEDENGWRPQESDNDGLWTAMYGAGEIFRYGVLKEQLVLNPNDKELMKEVEKAKEIATTATEAVLLLANISSRTGEVDTYIRYLENDSNQASSKVLLKDKDFSLNVPTIGPNDQAYPIQDSEWLAPTNMEDWEEITEKGIEDDIYETRKRSIEGFMARTYILDGLHKDGRGDYSNGEAHFNDGYYYDITGDKAIGKKTTSTKVKWENFQGVEVDASGEIPARLAELFNTAINPTTGEPFSKNDVIYKGDTSTDEIIGHLFIYKIAYDILGEDDPELKQIIVDTVENFAKHMLDNEYSLRDATGQATTWGKTSREYFNNFYAWEDCSLNALVLLSTFKLAAYVTGEDSWENEYRMLALEQPYAYADLCSEYYERFAYLAVLNGGIDPNNKVAVNEWVLQNLNYSDEEMAMLAYYLLIQMESDSVVLSKYQDGMNDWWHSMQYSENALWYYIYQLAYPNEEKLDAYGNKLIDTAAWALSRHPIDTICWSASNENRPDFEMDGRLSRSKETGEIAVAPWDERHLHKYNGPSYNLHGSNPDNMEPATTYTLPYWLGRYHDMLIP